jgi:hypothetical protein
LLAKLVIKSEGTDGKALWKCVAPNCSKVAKGNPQQSRVLKHSATCTHLRDYDRHAYDLANKGAAGGSLAAQLEASASLPSIQPALATGNTSAVFTVGPSNLISPEGTLNMATLRVEGAKVKAQSRQKYQDEVDHIIMRLICVRGLVPNLIDSPEWKELMQKLSGTYKPTSGDTFRDKHIPREAAFVRNRQIEILKKEENLTLTFDGTTTRKPDSFYTAHATTPTRNTYFLDGHQGTGEHHDTKWVVDKLLKVNPL